MCIVMDGSERPIPEGATKISDNSISIVWRGNDGYIYKRSIPFLINNELPILMILEPFGIVPMARRYDKYTIKMTDLGETEEVTDRDEFIENFEVAISILQSLGIAHGDLTKYSVIVKGNKPYLIDFAESRFFSDVRPAKREGGNPLWAEKLIDELCAHLSE